MRGNELVGSGARTRAGGARAGMSSLAVLGACLVVSGQGIASAADAASPASPSVQQLQQALQAQQAQLQALQQQLQQLQQAQQARQAAAATPAVPAAVPPPAHAAPAPTARGNFGDGGFTLSSDDGANVLHIRGNVSVDGRYFTNESTPDTANTWLVRKLRPTFEGTLDNHYDFRIMPDFGNGKAILQDGWADARIAPWLVLEFGKFKAPVGLERLQLEAYQRFIEASLPSDLVPYRDLGAKIGGVIGNGLLSYDTGLFDGALDGGSTDGNSVPDLNTTGRFSWHSRVFASPLAHTHIPALDKLGFGTAATYVRRTGVASTTSSTSLLSSYVTPGQQSMFSYRADTAPSGASYDNATIASGIERRWVPQLFDFVGPVGVLSEYVHETQQVARQLAPGVTRFATLENDAWEVQGSWYITGEDEGYDSAGPRRDFGEGSPGAWELVARYHWIHFDANAFSGGANSFANPASDPQSAHALGVGVNWYLTHHFKVQMDYEVTRFTGGAPVGNRAAEHVLESQFALIY